MLVDLGLFDFSGFEKIVKDSQVFDGGFNRRKGICPVFFLADAFK